jgi:uncharacterized membrane protein YdjX (TVP38/TMEM64 family)
MMDRDGNTVGRRRSTWIVWGVFFAAAVAVCWSWYAGGIIGQMLQTDLTAAEKIDRLRQFFARFGPLAPAVYFLFVVAEVVIAPIPGLMLYAPGGVIFGGFLGGALSLAGNVVGAGIACMIARTIRPAWLNRWFSTAAVARVQSKLERYGGWLIFLVRLNPLTSSDMVSYAAGFTRIPLRTVLLATGAGMAPLCFAQAWLAESLVEAFPGLLYPLLGACGIYAILVMLVLWRMISRSDVYIPADDCAASD